MKKLITIIVILVGDKDFDINKFHEFLKRHNIRAIIPVKKGVHRGFYRNFMRQYWRKRTYHRRSIIESAISRLKRRCGGFFTPTKQPNNEKKYYYA